VNTSAPDLKCPREVRTTPYVRLRVLRPLDRLDGWLVTPAIAVCFVAFAALAVRSLDWEYAHDTPLLQYCGLLMDRFGRAPYRDFFETSMPGVFLFHGALVAVAGVGNIAFMAANLILLVVLLAASYAGLARISSRAAVLFIVWYGWYYLASGPSSLMQRDWLVLVPMAAAFGLMAGGSDASASGHAFRAFAIGSLVGVCTTIKPHLALGGAPILVGLALLRRGNEGSSRWAVLRELALLTVLPATVGCVLVLGGVLAWLISQHALVPFLSITLHYLPLHIQQTGEHVFLPPGRRLLYILATAPRLAGYARLGALALVGSVLIDRHLKREPRRRLLFRVAFALMAVYALTPALSGQFWDYHFDPFEFWLIAVLSLLVLPIGAGSGTGVLAALLLVAALGDSARRHHVIDPGPAKGGLVAEMAATIEKYVPAGAPIQTLDWTSGADHALLRTGHPIGTRFLYDYHFYHHVGTPVVQALQRTFIAELVGCRVPFILEVKRPYKDAVSGLGTSNHFEALETILGDRYELAHDARVYRLLRLKATYAGPAGDAAAGCDVAPPSRRGGD
jgi:hypothetical protein